MLFNDRRSATTVDLIESAGVLNQKDASTLGLNSYGYSGGKLPVRNDMPKTAGPIDQTTAVVNMR